MPSLKSLFLVSIDLRKPIHGFNISFTAFRNSFERGVFIYNFIYGIEDRE